MVEFASAIFSEHAHTEMKRRAIQESLVLQVLTSPDTVRPVREGRVVLQKTLIAGVQGKALLYRVFVDIDRRPPVVVTAYATSKISKYEVFQ